MVSFLSIYGHEYFSLHTGPWLVVWNDAICQNFKVHKRYWFSNFRSHCFCLWENFFDWTFFYIFCTIFLSRIANSNVSLLKVHLIDENGLKIRTVIRAPVRVHVRNSKSEENGVSISEYKICSDFRPSISKYGRKRYSQLATPFNLELKRIKCTCMAYIHACILNHVNDSFTLWFMTSFPQFVLHNFNTVLAVRLS